MGSSVILREAFRVAVIGQHFDDAAFIDPAAFALTDHAAKFGAQGFETHNFGFDIMKDVLRDAIDTFAGLTASIYKAQQFAHGFETKSKLSCVTDKGEPVGMGAVISPLPALGTGRNFHQALFLIVSDGLHVGRGAFREFADGEDLLGHGSLPSRFW
jgi:hypothetical protein